MLYLSFVFFKLFALTLNLTELGIVLLPDQTSLLLQRISKLRCVFNLPPTNQHLRIHSSYLFLEHTALFLCLHKLLRALFQSRDSSVLVNLSSATLLFQLMDFWENLRPSHIFLLLKLLLQLAQFYLILPQQSPLVNIFVDTSFILNFLCSSGELQG